MIIKVRLWAKPTKDSTAAVKYTDEYIDNIDRITVDHVVNADKPRHADVTHALGWDGEECELATTALVLRSGKFELIEVYTAAGDEQGAASVEAWLMANDGGTVDRLI